MRNAKRMRNGFARLTGRPQRAGVGAAGAGGDVDMRGPNPDLAQIVPTLRLRVNGVVEQSDEEEEDEQADAGRYRPQPRMAEPIRKTASSLSYVVRFLRDPCAK